VSRPPGKGVTSLGLTRFRKAQLAHAANRHAAQLEDRKTTPLARRRMLAAKRKRDRRRERNLGAAS
jgi:hypothetical protein